MEFNYANELSGKTALVTGGTKGTGKAIAERLLKAGAKLIITARNLPEVKEEAFHFIAADLATAEGTQKVLDEIPGLFGGVEAKIIEISKKSEPKNAAPEVIANLILKAINAQQPKTRYHGGYLAGALLFFKKVLTDKQFDKLMLSQMK